MRTVHRHVAIISAGAFAGVVAFTLAAHADLEVLSSSASEITVGTVLSDDAVIKIPDGSQLQLVRSPQGTTHTLSGPFEGTLNDYENRPQCAWWQNILGMCVKQPRDPLGGVEGGVRGKPQAGGTRSVVPIAGGVKSKPSVENPQGMAPVVGGVLSKQPVEGNQIVAPPGVAESLGKPSAGEMQDKAPLVGGVRR